MDTGTVFMRLLKNTLPVIIIPALLASLLFFAPNLFAAYADEKLSGLERDILNEVNLARTDPQTYKLYLREFRNRYRGYNLYIKKRTVIKTREGISAVDEALKFMDSQRPLGALKLSEGMTRGARDHVREQGSAGGTGHVSAGGSSPGDRVDRHGKWQETMGENIYYGSGMGARQIVMGFIIDDGVPDRGHREAIFNPRFRVAGVACGPHKVYRTMCVVTFAAGYREKNAP
jgi:uncharacterized protein YkwD